MNIKTQIQCDILTGKHPVRVFNVCPPPPHHLVYQIITSYILFINIITAVVKTVGMSSFLRKVRLHICKLYRYSRESHGRSCESCMPISQISSSVCSATGKYSRWERSVKQLAERNYSMTVNNRRCGKPAGKLWSVTLKTNKLK
jgi:hypothetical protein